MGEVVYLRSDPWMSKRQAAREFGVSVSYIEKRIAAGMPSDLIAGKRMVRYSTCRDWLVHDTPAA